MTDSEGNVVVIPRPKVRPGMTRSCPTPQRIRGKKNRMLELGTSGSVGVPLGNWRHYPANGVHDRIFRHRQPKGPVSATAWS